MYFRVILFGEYATSKKHIVFLRWDLNNYIFLCVHRSSCNGRKGDASLVREGVLYILYGKGDGKMTVEEIFLVLGIEKTKDEKQIKAAYRSKLVTTNPEDDPEGFKKLRAAYEEACSYARSIQDEEEPQRDVTPSGLWVERAQKLYATRSGRCDIEGWKALFQEDVFVSLDGNEECRRKLLIFMMNHFQFPDSVWRLIEENLEIAKDSVKLKEQFPADFIDFLVRRGMTSEVIDFSLFQGAEEADYDAYIRCYNACWEALQEKNIEKIEDLMVQAEKTGITHPYMEMIRAGLYKEKEDKAKAQEILEQLLLKYPEEGTILYELAEFYWENEQHDKAADCYLKLKAQDEIHYMANYRLSFWYVEKEQYQAAKECTQVAIRRGQDDAIIELHQKINHALKGEYLKKWQEEKDAEAALEIVWGYLQDDKFYAAIKMAEEIKDVIPEEKKSDYYGLLARIYMRRAEYEKAVETAQKWLKELEREENALGDDEKAQQEHDRNVGIAHRIKLSSYHMMGRGFKDYYEKAVTEYEQLGDAALKDLNILIEVARVYLEKEEYQKCLDIAELLRNRYQLRYAYVLMMEAYVKLWDAGGVIRCGMQCVRNFPDYARPYEEMAKVYYDLDHKEELEDILKQAQENKIESIYLEAYRDALASPEAKEDYKIGDKMDTFQKKYANIMSRTGNPKNYEKGFEEVTKHLMKYPCNYILNTRGLFSMSAKEYEKALKDFYKILESDPADQFAHNNIGCVLKYQGKYEEALPYFEQAFYYMYREGKEEPNAMPLGNAAHTYELMGEYKKAAEVYVQLIETMEGHKTSYITNSDISCNYARSGQLDKALAILEQNMKENRSYAKLRYRACLYAGDWKKAEEMLENYRKQITILAMDKYRLARHSEYEHMLAWECLRKGKYEEAVTNMNSAAALPFNNDQITAKERIDLYVNKLFFLTLAITNRKIELEKAKLEDPSMEQVAQLQNKGILGKLSRFLMGNKEQQQYGTVNKKDNVIEKWETQLMVCADELNGYLNNTVCVKQTDGTRNLIHTKQFFYKDRYAMFVEFVVALYLYGMEAGEKALEEMLNSSRCRLCNHGFCMRNVLAKALLLERKGEVEEAKQLYQSLYAGQNYNLYAWCGARMKEE